MLRIVLLLYLCLFIQPTETPPDARVLPMEDRLRVREYPNKDAEIITALEANIPLTVVGKSSGGLWLQIVTPDNLTGWVSIEFVEVYIDLDTVAITYDQGLNFQGNKLFPLAEQRVQKIYADGQAMGNRAGVFSKVGDSITAASHMYQAIGAGLYYLGDYEYLQNVINFYSVVDAREGNSFVNPSLAAGIGWTSAVLFDTDFSDPELCEPEETPLLCEYRVVKPSVALIMIGTNDLTHRSPESYRNNVEGIVDITIKHGIVPVLSTIPYREGYQDEVAAYNQVIKETTQKFAIPLWDFNTVIVSLPNFGLDADGVHPTIPPRGYDGSADFHEYNLYSGYVMRNLTALQMLDAVWRITAKDLP